MNFDLNLKNYKQNELEEIFDLPANYSEQTLQQQSELLRQRIENDKNTDVGVKVKTLEFLVQAKNFLMAGLKKILNDAKMQMNVYNTDLTLRDAPIISENGSNYIIDRRAIQTPFNLSLPGDTFPGVINPLKKRTIIKNLNIDTRFRDNYYTSSATNFQFDIPYKFSSVTSMQLTSFEYIQSYYTIAECLGNNFMWIESNDGSETELILLPDGNYTPANLITVLNASVAGFSSTVLRHLIFYLNAGAGVNGNDKVFIGVNPTYTGAIFTFSVNFLVDRTGNIDSTPLQQKLGWMLGFRGPLYAGCSTYVSESVLDLSGPKYLFLVVDDYNNNVNENYFSAFTSSVLNKNILARIAVGPNLGAPFVVFDLLSTGSFGTPRTYFGPVDIQKLHVQLLDEYGRVLNLNGTDYSFVLALTTVYDI